MEIPLLHRAEDSTLGKQHARAAGVVSVLQDTQPLLVHARCTRMHAAPACARRCTREFALGPAS